MVTVGEPITEARVSVFSLNFKENYHGTSACTDGQLEYFLINVKCVVL